MDLVLRVEQPGCEPVEMSIQLSPFNYGLVVLEWGFWPSQLDVKEFIDLGHSGAKAHRPALDQIRAAARRGEVRQVPVFALDRLGRSLRDLLLLLDDLAASGCSVIGLRESIDLSPPTGRLLVQAHRVSRGVRA